tara:strand:+ start:2143 stop:3513 length:1371 start_codon:yes stop_codon:yes gene_type:complete
MNYLEGQKLVKQKEFGSALGIFLKLLQNEKKNNNIYFYLGLIYSELNDFNKSIFYYNKYLKVEPNSISVLHNLAIIKQSIGELGTAKEIYLKLIKLDKSNVRAYFGLLMLNINNLTIEHYLQINQIKKRDKISLYEKSLINFILAKKEKENKNYIKEIECLEDFNSDSYNSNYAYNQSSQFYYNKIINNHYNKINFIDNSKVLKKTKNFIPIFIIGLPRSGSTLIESILTSSDEKITTCGESHVINMSLLEQVGHKIYIENFDIKKFIFEIDNINFQKSVLKRYNKFHPYNEKESFSLIDKSLENFYNIEAILNIFPNAKFLHTYRNAIDATISIYQAMLSELSWTHKIEDILNYINNYREIMKHFHLKYPEKIMDINLENFTQDSERAAENIFEFCELKWNKKALEFYKRNDLFSKTASFNQIRKKVSAYDIKKYEPYIHLLQNYKNKYNWLKIN